MDDTNYEERSIKSLLLTNDDGFDAPGMAALQTAIAECLGTSLRVFVAAPDRGRSECGHGVTTGRPLAVNQRSTDQYSIDGTPVDCVRVALTTFAANVDGVVSGINAGANLGVDLLVSGTFAAAREAAIMGKAAIAISHYRHPDVPKSWDHAGRWLRTLLNQWASEGTPNQVWNANLPAIDPSRPSVETVLCEVDPTPMTRTAKISDGQYESVTDFHGRPRLSGRDVELCFGGSLTVSRIRPFAS